MGGALAPWHVVIVAVVFLLLFGAKRLPDSARALGQSLRIFKAETKGLRADVDLVAPVAPVPSIAAAVVAPPVSIPIVDPVVVAPPAIEPVGQHRATS